jgi:hypothetical protein
MRSAKTFLTKIDCSVGLADRDFVSRQKLPRRLESIDFGTPPPGSVRGTLERRGTNGLVKCMLVTKCIVIVLLYPCKYQCKTVSLYRSTLYVQYVIREETRVFVPNICVLHFRIGVLHHHRDFH